MSTRNGTMTTEQLEAGVAQQREELARTVQDLHDRLDVKSRAERKARDIRDSTRDEAVEVKERATTASGRPRPALVAGGAAAVAVPLAVLAVRAARRRRRPALRAAVPAAAVMAIKKGKDRL